MINVVTKTATHVDTDGGWMQGIVFNPPLGTRVYIAHRDTDTVTVRNATTYDLIATIPVGGRSARYGDQSRRSRVYVVNQGDHTVSQIRTSTNTVLKTIDVGFLPNEVAISPPDGTRAYVTNGGSDTVSVLQLV